jgi:hypothetical protein
MKKSFWFFATMCLLAVIFCTKGGLAQNTFVKYIYDERDFSKPQFILFYDSVAHTTDTFDIFKNNPFNNFRYEVLRDISGMKVYRLNRQEYDEIVPAVLRKNYDPEADSIAKKLEYLVGDAAIINCKVDNPSANPVLAYSFLVYDASGELYVGATAYYYILDRHGKIVHISKKLGVNVNEIYISEDNQYVGFNYGAKMNNEYISCGIRIYDALTDSLIFDMPVMDLETVGFIGSKFVVTEYAYTPTSITTTHNIYYLDAATREVGKYTFPSREAWLNSGNMRSDSKGLYFENLKGEKLNLLFDRDFIGVIAK